VGLAVFASDNLSSTAYATQEIPLVLALAGPAAFRYVFPISLAILSLLVIVTISYEQTIHVPTYFFIAAMFVTLGTAFFRYFAGTLGQVVNPPPLEVHAEQDAVTIFLLMHAFANGTTAVTGVEAISNGITAFREPRSRNAGVT
jgi:hypothetical protein